MCCFAYRFGNFRRQRGERRGGTTASRAFSVFCTPDGRRRWSGPLPTVFAPDINSATTNDLRACALLHDSDGFLRLVCAVLRDVVRRSDAVLRDAASPPPFDIRFQGAAAPDGAGILPRLRFAFAIPRRAPAVVPKLAPVVRGRAPVSPLARGRSCRVRRCRFTPNACCVLPIAVPFRTES